MEILDRSVLTAEQRATIDWQSNLLEEDYTHVMVDGVAGDYEILEMLVCIKLADYITDPAFKLVRL